MASIVANVLSVEHPDKFPFHLVINGAVSGKCLAAVGVPRHGGNQTWVFHLLVEVADEGLACRMGGCHIAEHPLFGLSGQRIEHSDHTVYASEVKHELDIHVVLSLADGREQTLRDMVVSCQYLLGCVA